MIKNAFTILIYLMGVVTGLAMAVVYLFGRAMKRDEVKTILQFQPRKEATE